MKGLMIKVGPKVAGDLISSSSLFSFTRWNGLGADNRSSLVPESARRAPSFQSRQITSGAS